MSPIDVRIEKLVYGGEGLARIPSPDGRQQVAFVPFTLPGELVRVELEPPRQGRSQAKLLEVLEPAAERIAPGCEYFGHCGGCQLQHAPPERQLELKREILLETLQRTGGVTWPGAVGAHAAEAWGYRNHIRVRAVAGIGVGYRMRASRRILPITHCPIASPELNRGLASLSTTLPEGNGDLELAVNNRDEGLESDAPLQFEVAGHTYLASEGAFFQANRFLAGALVEQVTGGTSGGLAVDLFSGVGLFALPLAERFRQVIAVEGSPAASADLRHNGAKISNLEVREEEALEFLQRTMPEGVDLLVADPPRAGLGREACAALLRRPPRRLHLVSCDPATLGRDLGWLTAGGYRIEALDLFDLFPQTYHIETVTKLSLED